MKQLIHFTNVLFRARGQIILALLLFTALAIAQELPPQEFIFGGTSFRTDKHSPDFYNKFSESGMNFLSQYADDISRGYLLGLDFEAVNGERLDEWIFYYSTAYYSKWETEEDQQTWDKVGVKHDTGSLANYLGRQCWSTEGLSSPACSLVYGPHYHQEKVYKRWPDKDKYPEYQDYDRYDLRYTPRFIMALTNPYSVPDTQVVCRLYVVATYREANPNPYGNDTDIVLKERTLRVYDFAPYDSFKTFYLGEIVDTAWYQYPPEFRDPQDGSNKRENLPSEGIQYFDRWGGQGVQFCIDWLRNDDKCTLYIDYVEVYDNDGGNDFANDLSEVVDKIIDYAEDFPQSEWPNMKYWAGCDEPSSLDDYIPMKTVDSILDSIGAPRLLTTFYPWWEITVNKDTQLVRYYNTVHPEKLMIDFFPFVDFRDPAGFEDWETTRKMLQICSSLDSNFYYQAAAFGYKVNGNWKNYRRPDTCEYKAQIMLALAHGVKGILNYTFNSLYGTDPPYDGTYGIIDQDYTTTDLYDVIKNNLVPRLKGTLGQTLMKLDYTSDFVNIYYKIPTEILLPPPLTHEYLTVGCGPPTQAKDMYWHFGFFNRPNYPEDKYFFTTNLMQWRDSSEIRVCLTPPSQGYSNYRFRNIEGYFDTTFTSSLAYILKLKKGEGYLYEVAPVVK
jgi:hypothetical protein